LQITDWMSHNSAGIMAPVEQRDIAVGDGEFNFTQGDLLNQLFGGHIIMQLDC